MAPPVSTPVKAPTPVLAHLVGLATVVKPELPTSVPTIFALMEAPAKAQV